MTEIPADIRKAAHDKLMSELFLACQPSRGDVFSFMDDHPEFLDEVIKAGMFAERRRWVAATSELVAWAENNVEVTPNSEVDPDNGIISNGYRWADISCERDRIVDWFGPTDFGMVLTEFKSAHPLTSR